MRHEPSEEETISLFPRYKVLFFVACPPLRLSELVVEVGWGGGVLWRGRFRQQEERTR